MADFHENTRPYPGLRPFESWEGELFFGREEHTNRLLDILQQQRFLAVIGASGSGKSSLVRAGLLPALPLGCMGTGSDWRTVVMRPGNRPMQRLAQSLLKRSALGMELVGKESLPENELSLTADVAMVEAELRRGSLGLFNVVKHARSQQTGNEPFNLLILIDQFEEIFTYADAGGRQADESEAFVNLLLAPRMAKDALIFVVITMRTDFLSNCVRFLELPDAINRAQYLTPRLTREQIERVITGPAQLFDGQIEATLVTELINEVSDDSDQLPILQHALARMWDKAVARDADTIEITWQDFQAVGGIANALSGHSDEILASLSPKNIIEDPLCSVQQTAEALFRAITDQRRAEAGGQAVRRAQTLESISEWSGRAWEEFKPVIDAYAQEGVNFLHINSMFRKDAVVDISHEALIRQWKRLQEWVAQEARFADEYKRLREHTEQWLQDELREADSGSLLTGANLFRALEWQAGGCNLSKTAAAWQPNERWAERYRGPGNSHRAAFADVIRFIDNSNASRLDEKRIEQRNKKIQTGLTLVCAVFMCVAVGFALQAKSNQDKADQVLTKLLWSPLDFTDAEINDKQAAGLLALAHTDDAKKQIFLEQLFSEQSLAESFNNKPDAIIRALAGVDPEKAGALRDRFNKERLENHAGDEADARKTFRIAKLLAQTELDSSVDVKQILAATARTKIPYTLDSGFYDKAALIKAVAQVPEQQLDNVVDLIIASAADPNVFYPDYSTVLPTLVARMPAIVIIDKILLAMHAANYKLDVVDALSELLLKVAENLPESEVEEVFDQLLMAMQATPIQTDLADALKMAAKRANSAEASLLINKLLTSMSAAKDPDKPYYYVESLAVLADKTPENQTVAVIDKLLAVMKAGSLGEYVASALAMEAKNAPESQARPLMDRLLAAMQDALTPDKPGYYSKCLANVARKTPVPEAVAVFDKLLDAAKESPQREDIGNALTMVANRTPEKQVRDLLARLLVFMRNGGAVDDVAFYSARLAAVARQAPEDQAVAIFDQLFSLMKQTKDPTPWTNLAHALTPVSEKIPTIQASAIFDKLLAAIKEAKNAAQREELETVLAMVGKRLPADQARVQVEKLLAVMKDSRNAYQQNYYVAALMAVANQAAAEQAAAVIASLFAAMKDVKDPDKPYYYSAALPEAAEKLPEEQAVVVFDQLLTLMKQVYDSSEQTDLAKALLVVSSRAPENQVYVINKLLDAMQHAKESDKPAYYSASLSAAAEKTPATEAVAMFNHLFAALKAGKASDQQRDIAKALVVAFKHVPQPQILDLIDPFLVAVKESKDSGQLSYFADGLPVIVSGIAETQAYPLAQKLSVAILNSDDQNQIDMLCHSLIAVASRLMPENAAEVLFKALDNPLSPRDKLTQAIREKFPDSAPKAEQGYWSLIAWGAEKQLSHL